MILRIFLVEMLVFVAAAPAYADGQMPVGWLLQAPNVDAKANIPEGAAKDVRLSIDGTLDKLLACSAN